MAPRPAAAASRSAAARGCHAIQSQIAITPSRSVSVAAAAASPPPPLGTPPPSPIWISDTLLARAFARFSRVSHAGRATATGSGRRHPTGHVRLSSSVPGPLEARRRLGRRQMTEQLGGLAQHPLPPLPYPFLTAGSSESGESGGGGGWGASALSSSSSSAYSLDPRLWQWAPPRDPARHAPARQTQTQTRSLPWLARMGDVLGGLTTPQPEPATAPPPQPPQPPSRRPPQPQQPQEQAPPPISRSAVARAFFGDLEAWRHSPAAAATAPSFAQSFDAICGALETQLSLAALTADEADEALGLLWAGLAQAANASPSAASFLRVHAPVLFTAVLRGVRDCQLLPADAAAVDLGAAFWRRLLEAVCTLSGSDLATGDAQDCVAVARLAADVLAATPPALLARDLLDLVPAILETVLCGAMEMNDTRIAAVAAALQDVVVGEEEQETDKSSDDVVTATTRRLLQKWTAWQQQQHQQEPPPPQENKARTAVTTVNSVSTGLHAWLGILAHMPHVRQERLFAVLAQAQECVQATTPCAESATEDVTTVLFSDAFLCDLLLAQWNSRSYIPTDVVLQAYQKTLRENDDAPSVALAALALAVYQVRACRPRCVALYVSLLTCLRRLDRGEAALAASVEALMEATVQRQGAAALATTSASPLPLPFLEALAWAGDDLPTALRLHTLYAVHARRCFRASQDDTSLRFLRAMADDGDSGRHESRTGRRRRGDGWPLWRLAFWNKFADRLGVELDRGTLTPGQVSFALDLGERWNGGRDNNNKTKTLGEPTVALLERLAMHYALAPEFLPRRALRGVEQCRTVLFQYASTGSGDERAVTPAGSAGSAGSPPSSTILRAIFHLITRDLDDAQPGRTSRLRWYVAMVQREHGAAAAKVSAHALERWRMAARRVDRRQSEPW